MSFLSNRVTFTPRSANARATQQPCKPPPKTPTRIVYPARLIANTLKFGFTLFQIDTATGKTWDIAGGLLDQKLFDQSATFQFQPQPSSRFGHSAMSAQCPVCPKADRAGRFMSTRP